MPVYCTPEDLEVPSSVLATVEDAWVTEAIQKASAIADGYFASHWTLPLIPPYPADLVDATAAIATYRVMKKRGYSPEVGVNDQFRSAYTDAMHWLADVSSGKATPQVRGSDTDADAQEGGGPSSATFALQPSEAAGGNYNQDEDFWHDRPSVGATRSPRKRGW